ncbi:hypothetical protein CQW23_01108 [Capsicum baccatum]|uniref:Uncharacterized protein n=1 Tax=Capsicum baccatum TaxID=33114 RepID=A0A2G2XMM8_CAPBA|nr:hypothetical protein CQW23_01108 [Capsicum baccatum]
MTGFLNEDEDLRVVEADGFPRKIVRRCLEVYGRKAKVGMERTAAICQVPALSSEGLLLMYTRRTQPSADAEPISSACGGHSPTCSTILDGLLNL